MTDRTETTAAPGAVRSVLEWEMSRRKALTIMALSGGAAVAGAALGGVARPARVRGQDAPVPGGEFRFAPNFEPDTLDPHASAGSSSFVILISAIDTLVLLNPDDKLFYGYLAESWEVSDDGTVYTFTLRPGITFHDGTPFNAEAVKFNLDRIVDPATASPLGPTLLGPYVGSTVVDDLTVEVQLTEPYPPLLDGLSQVAAGILSPTAVQTLGADIAVNPVGTGFMKFERYTAQESVAFVRNEDYNWAPEIWGHQGPAYLERMTFLIIPEPAARVTALEAGDANGIEDTPAQDVLRLQDDPAYTLIEARLPGAPRTFFMNTERAPLDDLRVRQAISHGLDVTQVVQLATFGLQPAATGPFSEPTLGYSSQAENFYPYDVARAEALLEEAGWTMGSDGIRVKDGEPLRLIAIGFPVFEQLYIAAQSLLRAIGVDMDVQILDAGAATAANQAGEGHLAMTGVVTSDPSGIALLYHSRNYDGFAFSRWQDPAFDQLWDDAAVETDPDARLALYEQIQLYIMENALSVPTQQIVRFNFVHANVQGVRQDARGLYPWLYDVHITA